MMSETKYTISVKELIERPNVTDIYEGNMKWMNKMTEEELKQWDKEAYAICLEEGTPNKYPDLNAAHLSKCIDRGILYNLFLMADE